MDRLRKLLSQTAVLVLALLLFASIACAASEDAPAYRTNTAHTGQATMPDFAQPVGVLWDTTLPGPINSYTVVGGSQVFAIVTTQTTGQNFATFSVYALDAKSGAINWGPVALPTGEFAFDGSALTYDNGTVFVSMENPNTEGGLMLAYDATTGASLWTATYSGQWWSDDFPTALNGVIYTQEAGNVSAIQESNGAVQWTTTQLETEDGGLAVSGTGLYISGAGGDSFSLSQSNGNVIWPLFTGVEGGGGYTCTYDAANNILFIRDYYDPNQFAAFLGAALNGSTGAVITSYTDEGQVAVDNGLTFGISNNALIATKESNWSNAWTVSNGVDPFTTDPTVVNGIVYAATQSGELEGFNEQTGASMVKISLNDKPSGGINDMTAGDGIIAIPAGADLVAVGTPFANLTLTLNPASPNGTNNWYTKPVVATVTTTAGTIHYSIDNGAATAYTGPVTISGDAKHTFSYWVTDSSGDSTVKQTASIWIDSTPPVSTNSVSGAQLADGRYGGSATVTLKATDNLSGVASTVYTIDGGASTTYSTPFTITTAGSHTIAYHSVDSAGNAEQSDSLTVDIGPSVLHTFQAGLQMISTPKDDSAFTLDQIFDVSPVTLAWWDPAVAKYDMTPTPPANTLKDGLGYWVRFTSTTDLLSVGQPTDTNSAFTIPLAQGWNMIGDPEPNSVATDILTVVDGSGNSFPVGQAGSLVGSEIYTWQLGDTKYEALTVGSSLQPFEGYWVFAFVPCTLEFPGNPGGPPGSPLAHAHR